MKLRFILSLFVALLIAGTTYAANSASLGIDDGLVLKGEFSDTGSCSVNPALPMSAGISGNILYIGFSAALGDVAITVTGPLGVVYSASMNVATVGQQTSFSLEGLTPGIYLLEFKNSHGGYVYGEFIID